jgi:hypothetical protein
VFLVMPKQIHSVVTNFFRLNESALEDLNYTLVKEALAEGSSLILRSGES